MDTLLRKMCRRCSTYYNLEENMFKGGSSLCALCLAGPSEEVRPEALEGLCDALLDAAGTGGPWTHIHVRDNSVVRFEFPYGPKFYEWEPV